MTREEAIKRLSKYVHNSCYTIEHQEACAMAISALREQGGSFQNGNDHNMVKDWPPYLDLPREQEERSKACPYCDIAKANEGVRNTVLWVKEPETKKWTMMGKKLLFCPMCGRRLEEV